MFFFTSYSKQTPISISKFFTIQITKGILIFDITTILHRILVTRIGYQGLLYKCLKKKTQKIGQGTEVNVAYYKKKVALDLFFCFVPPLIKPVRCFQENGTDCSAVCQHF